MSKPARQQDWDDRFAMEANFSKQQLPKPPRLKSMNGGAIKPTLQQLTIKNDKKVRKTFRKDEEHVLQAAKDPYPSPPVMEPLLHFDLAILGDLQIDVTSSSIGSIVPKDAPDGEFADLEELIELNEAEADRKPYHLCRLEALGRGSSAIVYKAVLLNSLTICAEKVVVISDPVKRTQSLRELQSLRKAVSETNCDVRCKYIVHLLDIVPNPVDGTLSVCLEYMNGGSLFDIMKSGGCSNETVVRGISKQILQGLELLHSLRIIHRDVKPSNALVSSDGTVKLADFGLARTLDAGCSLADSFVGTFDYMAPERMVGESYSFLSDVWSVGLTIHSVAIGRYPYQRDSCSGYWGILNAMEEQPVPLPSATEFSEEFVDFIRKACMKDPGCRPTASTLLTHPFLAETVTAPRLLGSTFVRAQTVGHIPLSTTSSLLLPPLIGSPSSQLHAIPITVTTTGCSSSSISGNLTGDTTTAATGTGRATTMIMKKTSTRSVKSATSVAEKEKNMNGTISLNTSQKHLISNNTTDTSSKAQSKSYLARKSQQTAIKPVEEIITTEEATKIAAAWKSFAIKSMEVVPVVEEHDKYDPRSDSEPDFYVDHDDAAASGGRRESNSSRPFSSQTMNMRRCERMGNNRGVEIGSKASATATGAKKNSIVVGSSRASGNKVSLLHATTGLDPSAAGGRVYRYGVSIKDIIHGSRNDDAAGAMPTATSRSESRGGSGTGGAAASAGGGSGRSSGGGSGSGSRSRSSSRDRTSSAKKSSGGRESGDKATGSSRVRGEDREIIHQTKAASSSRVSRERILPTGSSSSSSCSRNRDGNRRGSESGSLSAGGKPQQPVARYSDHEGGYDGQQEQAQEGVVRGSSGRRKATMQPSAAGSENEGAQEQEQEQEHHQQEHDEAMFKLQSTTWSPQALQHASKIGGQEESVSRREEEEEQQKRRRGSSLFNSVTITAEKVDGLAEQLGCSRQIMRTAFREAVAAMKGSVVDAIRSSAPGPQRLKGGGGQQQPQQLPLEQRLSKKDFHQSPLPSTSDHYPGYPDNYRGSSDNYRRVSSDDNYRVASDIYRDPLGSSSEDDDEDDSSAGRSVLDLPSMSAINTPVRRSATGTTYTRASQQQQESIRQSILRQSRVMDECSIAASSTVSGRVPLPHPLPRSSLADNIVPVSSLARENSLLEEVHTTEAARRSRPAPLLLGDDEYGERWSSASSATATTATTAAMTKQAGQKQRSDEEELEEDEEEEPRHDDSTVLHDDDDDEQDIRDDGQDFSFSYSGVDAGAIADEVIHRSVSDLSKSLNIYNYQQLEAPVRGRRYHGEVSVRSEMDDDNGSNSSNCSNSGNYESDFEEER